MVLTIILNCIYFSLYDSLTVTGTDNATITITVASNKAVITAIPFRIDLYNNDVLSVSLNAKGLMRFEHLRTKDEVYV